jgi:hypothetical protein
MSYVSDKQKRFFHTDTAREKGIGSKAVKEFDKASKGMHLPESVHHHKKGAIMRVLKK